LCRIHKKDDESSIKLNEMLKEIKELKKQTPVKESPKKENEENILDLKVKEILQCAYLMQKSAFELEIDTKFPFFFTQLNKIKLATEKIKKELGNMKNKQKLENEKNEQEKILKENAEKETYEKYKEILEETKKENEFLRNQNEKLKIDLEILQKETMNFTKRKNSPSFEKIPKSRDENKNMAITFPAKYSEKSDQLRDFMDALEDDITKLRNNISFACNKSYKE